MTRATNLSQAGLAIIAAILLASISCSGPDPAPPAADDSRNQPSEAYIASRDASIALGRSGRFLDAIVQVRDALAEAPDLREPYALASGFYQEGLNDPGAIEFFDFMTGTMPEKPWPWFYRGFHQARLGRWTKATESFRQAAAILPGDAEILYYLGRAHEEAGDRTAALSQLKRARELDPAGGAIAAALTRLLAFHGELGDAEKVYEDTLMEGNSSPDLLHALGMIRTGQSRLDEAEIAFRNAIRLKPDHLNAHQALERLLERSGRTEEAERQSITTARLEDYEIGHRAWVVAALEDSDSKACLALAELELTEGNVEQAMIWFDRAERLGGTTDRLRAGRAEALYVLDEIDAGDRELAGVRQISDARVALARAVRFLSTEDAGMAQILLDKAVKSGPEEREFLRRASDLYETTGLHARSIALLERAAEANRNYTAENGE